MKITLVCVGRIKEKFLADGISEYAKRLSPFAKLNVIEIGEEKQRENPSEAERQRAIIAEGERLLKQIPKDAYIFVLDVKGKECTSEELAAKIDTLKNNGQGSIAFVIGGAFGLSDEVREAADERLSLSKLTFTHQMARFFLTEQIYRAFKISRGEKYHW